MMTTRLIGGCVAFACTTLVLVSASGCGGGGYSNSSPATPSPTPTTTASSMISIVGIKGAQSFTPDPASVTTGSTFAWKNNDGVTHHIVFDDGSVDSGNLAPGAMSAVMTMASNGARYHCTIHPTMVGSINTSSGNPPPCTGLYCDSTK